MSIFDEITQAPDPGPEPRGPGKCPTPGCEELESGWSPTGQCPTCVDAAHAEAERALIEATVGKWIVEAGKLRPTRDEHESLKQYLARTGKKPVVTAVVDQVAVFKMLEPSHDCPCGNRFYETIDTCPACGRPQWCES